MAAPATSTTCKNHRRREAVTTCAACGSPICRDCLVPTGVGMKCQKCTGMRSPVASVARGPAKEKRERPPWLIPVAVAVVAVLLIAVVRSGGGGGDDDQQVATAPNTDLPTDRAVDMLGVGRLALKGTLTLPAGGKPAAAVLLVPGFGTMDRDKVMSANTPGAIADRLAQEVNLGSSGTPDAVYEDLSKALVAANLATLRYDKRGIGRSTLAEGAPKPTYDDIVGDAKATLNFLRERREVEGLPLVVVGFDQGGVTAMRLAAEPGVKAVVLVSTPSRPVPDVLIDHFVRTHGQTVGFTVSEELRAVQAQLNDTGRAPDRSSLSGHLRPMFPTGAEGYLKQVFAVDPVAEARAVKVPALVVRGGSDVTVTADDVTRLTAVLPSGSEVITSAGGDHNLAVDGKRDPEATRTLGIWITRHLG